MADPPVQQGRTSLDLTTSAPPGATPAAPPLASDHQPSSLLPAPVLQLQPSIPCQEAEQSAIGGTLAPAPPPAPPALSPRVPPPPPVLGPRYHAPPAYLDNVSSSGADSDYDDGKSPRKRRDKVRSAGHQFCLLALGALMLSLSENPFPASLCTSRQKRGAAWTSRW